MKKSITPQPFVPAMPVVIVAVKDNERINFAAHGMHGALSYDPPLVYVSVIKEHMTAKMITKVQKFSINIANTELLDKVKYCGGVSGVEKDKSKEFEVFYGTNDVPMILKCPASMNCEVYQTIYTKDMYIFIARVVELFADDECVDGDVPVAVKVDPLICTIQGGFHSMGDEVKK